MSNFFPLSTDPADPTGGTPPTPVTGTSVAPPPDPTPPAPPPAGKIVAEGRKTERELHLERVLKRSQTRIAELEDERQRLKAAYLTTPAPAPEETKSPQNRWTFFDAAN